MRHAILSLFGLSLGLSLGAAGIAAAQSGPVVVELFSSQGCSSCPPADALLGELAERDDVIALALHVDYWDYIGWKDTLADPAFTNRQHAYAAASGARTVYTPQMVVGGVDDVLGSDPVRLSAVIAQHLSVAGAIDLGLKRTGDTIVISATGSGTGPLDVQLIRYRSAATVEITRGENAGRTITYRNVVTSIRLIGRWDGQGPYRRSVEAKGDDPVVVLMQQPAAGAILAAAQLK